MNIRSFLILLAPMFFIQSLGFGQNKAQPLLRDTLDNALDLSQYLYGLAGFLPQARPILGLAWSKALVGDASPQRGVTSFCAIAQKLIK